MHVDILLFSGRIVKHNEQPNGSTLATPTPGHYAFTRAEYADYEAIVARMQRQGIRLSKVEHAWLI